TAPILFFILGPAFSRLEGLRHSDPCFNYSSDSPIPALGRIAWCSPSNSMTNPESPIPNPQSPGRRVHFIANCVYGTHLAGGDIHFFEMARAAAEAGYDVNFFGGFALQQHITSQSIKATITLSEQSQRTGINPGTLAGQIALFRDYYKRYRGTLRQLNQIAPDDVVYATTDYWFDVL